MGKKGCAPGGKKKMKGGKGKPMDDEVGGTVPFGGKKKRVKK